MNHLIRQINHRTLLTFGLTVDKRSVQDSLRYLNEITDSHFKSFRLETEIGVGKLGNVKEAYYCGDAEAIKQQILFSERCNVLHPGGGLTGFRLSVIERRILFHPMGASLD